MDQDVMLRTESVAMGKCRSKVSIARYPIEPHHRVAGCRLQRSPGSYAGTPGKVNPVQL